EINGIILHFRDITERRKHEDALLLSEARLRQIIDLIPGYIYARDAEGRYLLANSMTARAFRRRVSEIEGHTHAELDASPQFGPDSMAADREVIQSSKIKLLPAETLHLDSKRQLILRTYKIPYVSPGSEIAAALSVSIDITELKQAEAALRTSEANLRAMLENTHTGYMLLDAAGKILACNQLIRNWYRREIGQAQGLELSVGQNFPNLMPAERRAEINTRLSRVLAGECLELETNFKRPDGSQSCYALNYQGIRGAGSEPLGVCLAVTDITVRRQIEQKLRDNEAHLLASQQVAHVGSWELDLGIYVDINTNPLRWSDECFRVFGFEPGAVEVSNELFFSLVPPEQRPAIEAAISQALATDGVYSIEHQILRPDGSLRSLHERGEIFRDPQSGERLKMIGTVQDITELRQSERERNQLLLDLLRRNQALEEYSFIVSHNLRAPVANLLGLVDLLQADLPVSDQGECLMGITQSVGQLEAITLDLNSILQVKPGVHDKRAPLRLSELVAELRQDLSEALQAEHAALITDFAAADELNSNHSAVYSVLFNLLSNSLRFRSPDREPRIEISSRREADKLWLRVCDNGLGIDLKQSGKQLFGLYKRFHPHVGGRGVGLFMVKAQIERLGGQIKVNSSPGQGTEFEIELPTGSA
ncbi:MAG: hypothetical protein CVV27_17235, partial [Candidatus Melainabacteria bacterium HGW-Melainabacteria-1]